MGMSLLRALGPAVWPKSLDLHPRSLQGAQLQPSNRWCNELWATSGAAETWGPLAPRLGPLNNASFSLPPPVLSHQELLSAPLSESLSPSLLPSQSFVTASPAVTSQSFGDPLP